MYKKWFTQSIARTVLLVVMLGATSVVLLQLMLNLVNPWLQTGADLVVSGVTDARIDHLTGGSLLVLALFTGMLFVSFGAPAWVAKKVATHWDLAR